MWLNFMDQRNISVHDYLGIPEKDFVKRVKSFVPLVEKALSKL